MTAKAKPIWRSGADKVAHSFHRGDRRTACGLRIVAERLAHTPDRRCEACLATVGFSVAWMRPKP